MGDLQLNPRTKLILDAYIKKPSHALCLEGRVGVGLGTIAGSLASTLSGSELAVTTIRPEKGLISIDRIRTLYTQTRSSRKEKMSVVIDDADSMSSDAQNSLLKLLEEPVANVHFILTTHDASKLLPTIRSRVQTVQVMPLDRQTSTTVLGSLDHDAADDARIMFLAGGRVAEMIRLVGSPEYFAERSELVGDARTFLQSNPYEQLKITTKYTAREQALAFLTECGTLLQFSTLKQSRFDMIRPMDAIETVMSRIKGGGHVRTQLMYLMTKLS